MARNTLAPGGYIGGEPPRRPYFNQLSGVWKLEDAMERQKAGTWANPLGIEDLFSTYLYTGNSSTQTITNGIDLSGKGGLVWIKGRQTAFSHIFVDTARGATKFLSSNNTTSEQTAPNTVPSFSSTGFTAGTDNQVNLSGDNFASWTFRKAEKFFDVVTATQTTGNTGWLTFNHSLGSVPGAIVIKVTNATDNWFVYHRSTSSQTLFLNLTNAASATVVCQNVTSTSFEFNLANYGSGSGSTYVAYLFAHDAGGFGDSGNESVIKCGSFQDGPSYAGQLVNLGWEPQWVMIKRIGSADVNSGFSANWQIYDNMRGLGAEYNLARILRANTAETEFSNQSTLRITSQGFVPNLWVNTNDTYIYIAIRRGPMKAPADATKVFDVDATRSAAPLSYNAGFPVDMFIQGARSINSQKAFVLSRLTGSQALATNTTDAEAVSGFTFDSSIGIRSGASASSDHVGWMFRRAPGFFDVVAYTGTGANQQVAHNLGVVPEMMIIKSRNGAFGWAVYHSGMGTDLIELQSNIYGTSANPNWWDNGAPTSTRIKTPSGSNAAANRSGDNFVAYLFASCPGVSKVGSYTGTGTTLNVDCGFTNGARFVLIRRKDAGGDWFVWDTARGIVANNDPYLLLNSTAAEVTNTDYIDPLSSGFQISSTAPAAINANGGSFIFLAIA